MARRPARAVGEAKLVPDHSPRSATAAFLLGCKASHPLRGGQRHTPPETQAPMNAVREFLAGEVGLDFGFFELPESVRRACRGTEGQHSREDQREPMPEAVLQ